MNTSRAAVDCGLIFSEKEVRQALPQPTAVSEHRPGMRASSRQLPNEADYNLKANVIVIGLNKQVVSPVWGHTINRKGCKISK